jgi:predicted nucleic acid-binding protein
MSLAAITASELLVGVHLAGDPARMARRQAWVEQVLATFPTLPFDLPVARVHARLWSDLRSSGQGIGATMC